MKMNKMCFEFVWEGGRGLHRLGFGVSSSIYSRFLSKSSSLAYAGITQISDTGPKIAAAVNEAVMMCFDKSDISNYKMQIIKGSEVRTQMSIQHGE